MEAQSKAVGLIVLEQLKCLGVISEWLGPSVKPFAIPATWMDMLHEICFTALQEPWLLPGEGLRNF